MAVQAQPVKDSSLCLMFREVESSSRRRNRFKGFSIMDQHRQSRAVIAKRQELVINIHFIINTFTVCICVCDIYSVLAKYLFIMSINMDLNRENGGVKGECSFRQMDLSIQQIKCLSEQTEHLQWLWFDKNLMSKKKMSIRRPIIFHCTCISENKTSQSSKKWILHYAQHWLHFRICLSISCLLSGSFSYSRFKCEKKRVRKTLCWQIISVLNDDNCVGYFNVNN